MAGIWPGDLRCPVVLSFDLDGRSSWLRRNPDFAKLPTLLSMADYGPKVAAWRILDLLDQHAIKASFFVPGYIVEHHTEVVREAAHRGHEISHHGYLHEPPATMTPEEEAEVLDRSTAIIQQAVGQRPLGYRSPSWELSSHSLEYLAQRGFLYDSSMMDDDAPYLHQTSSGTLVELPVHWLLDDAPFFFYAPAAGMRNVNASPDQVFNVWASEFEGLYRYGRAFILTMHPQHIGRPGRLLMLERLIQHIRSYPNVQFMRAMDLARLWIEHHH